MQNLSPIAWALRPLKNYANFSGRASRAEFWWFFLFMMIIYILALFAVGGMARGIVAMNPAADIARGTFSGSVVVVALFWLLLFIPTLAVQIRRLHDTNRSGWWLGAFWLLYVIYMGLTFSLMSSAMQSPGTPPNMGSFAAIGIFAMLFFVYSIVLFVFFCLRGTQGSNRYGDDPYGANVGEVFA